MISIIALTAMTRNGHAETGLFEKIALVNDLVEAVWLARSLSLNDARSFIVKRSRAEDFLYEARDGQLFYEGEAVDLVHVRDSWN